jgi:predicted MFS family arabinose efflux permease
MYRYASSLLRPVPPRAQFSKPGAFNQGWIAEKISRKYSICVAVCIFVVGSIIQTAAQDYAMLVVGRLIGGVGVGMYVLFIIIIAYTLTNNDRLSMVVPMYIAEVSPPEIRGMPVPGILTLSSIGTTNIQ